MEKKRSGAVPLPKVSSQQAAGPGQRPNLKDCDACVDVIGDLIADVVHELRGPLGVMLTSVHLVQARIGEDDPASIRGLERIRRGIDRCDNIIGNLQDYSANTPLRAEPTGLDQWLRAAIHAHHPPQQLSLEFKPGLGEARVLIDREKLGRAVMVIIDNAVLAATGLDRDGRISVHTASRDGQLEIGVADNGTGIAEEYRDKVFDPFFSTRRGGVGLGLAIARRFVAQHGGEIVMEHPAAGGSSFRILLPMERVALQQG